PYFLYLFLLIDPAPSDLYTLSLHDALPISSMGASGRCRLPAAADNPCPPDDTNALGYPQQLANVRTTDLPTLRLQATTHESVTTDRKSTRLNSSHVSISYAVFCLKKKKKKK